MILVVAILNAIAALPPLVGYLDKFCQAVVGWWVGRQQAAVLRDIADAAALGARAKTDEERYLAAEKWKAALSKPRTTV